MANFFHGKKSAVNRFTLVMLCILLAVSGGFFWGKASADEPPGATLAKVGPISGDNGFPVWFKDQTGKRLELCLDKDDPLCAIDPAELPDPTNPISFPDNFPHEAFYQLASAEMETGTGEKAVGSFQLEAAFTQEEPVDGDQIVFGRVRFRVFGLKPNTEYTITHPYGVDKIVSSPDDKDPANVGEIRFTEDIGDLNGGNPQLAMRSRIGAFLYWDPALQPAAPQGYIGDPNVDHPVLGSVYIDSRTGKPQNVFRVEGPGIAVGPNGTFSPNACKIPNTNDNDPNCIEVRDFSLMGKEATNSGVEIQQASYSRTTEEGGIIDVFASSEESAQSIEVSGVGFDPVRMVGENGQYFARVAFSGAVPEEITVTNVGDNPVSKKTFKLPDRITGSAHYDIDQKVLTITAESSDKAALPVLTAEGFGDLTEGVLEKTDVHYVPPAIKITSAEGGSAFLPVTIIGKSFETIPSIAFAGVDQEVVAGNTVTLDGSNSTGPIKSYSWEQVSGPKVELIGADSATPSFEAPAIEGKSEVLVFRLTISGPGDLLTSEVKVTVLDSAPAPVADAGEDQEVKQGSMVTLDGSSSLNTMKYIWKQTGGPEVTLISGTSSTPSFVFPKQPEPLTFELTASGPGGTHTDQVEIRTVQDNITVLSAEYRRSKREWRVEGTSDVFGPGVEVTMFIEGTNTVVGKAAVDALGSWRFRGTGPAINSSQRLEVKSSSGGSAAGLRVTIK